MDEAHEENGLENNSENSEERKFEVKKKVGNPKPSDSSKTWKIISLVLVLLLAVALFKGDFFSTKSLSEKEAKAKTVDYINKVLVGRTATITAIEKIGDLFKLDIDISGQKITSYLTLDGNLLFPSAINLNSPIPDITGSTVRETEEKVSIKLDKDDVIKGEETAPVTIIEYSDFECPFCKKYITETYPKIIEEYVKTGKVKYVFRDFPLSFHAKAQKAGEAAECAKEQDKFWEMHDKLFEDLGKGIETYKEYAKELGLDEEKFNDCLDSGKYDGEVKGDMQEGEQYGVTGTPAFFINGVRISGAQPYETFKGIIDEELGIEE